MAGLGMKLKRLVMGPTKNGTGGAHGAVKSPSASSPAPPRAGGQVVQGKKAPSAGKSALGVVRKRAIVLTLLTVISLLAGILAAFLLVNEPTAGSVLLSRLIVITFVVLLITLANVLYISYLTLIELGSITRAPKLALEVSNSHADGRPILISGRSNTLEISLVNQGRAAAKYIHVAFKWSGEGEANLRDSGGAYLDRRFWEEGDGRIRMYRGGSENVVLSGRSHPVAELHVPTPSGPIKLAFRVFCEDMDEVHGEVEIGVRDF